MRKRLYFHIPTHHSRVENQTEIAANQDWAMRSDIILNFLLIGHLNKRVMHISMNKILFQNQLTIGWVTHKLIYMLKPLNFINVKQTPLLYFNIVINKFSNSHIRNNGLITFTRKKDSTIDIGITLIDTNETFRRNYW